PVGCCCYGFGKILYLPPVRTPPAKPMRVIPMRERDRDGPLPVSFPGPFGTTAMLALIDHRRRAFSLIELLVVIAILGVLMGLTLCAVQKARAAAGCVQCANNLHQLLLAAHMHEDAQGYIPGNPYPGQVVGTTFYWLLPCLEQQATFEAHNY